MGHLVSGPNDIVVYGRAIARAYKEGREDASSEDIALRPWLARPLCVRAHAENADRGVGNVDPRRSIRQAAAIRLSEAGASWLNGELEAAYREFGKLTELR